ncbi:hypothetical protein HK101_001154 [Irineochytrium annulatum]|nr:hypothetical protein HK101_001154 [Irineochytrium annulatum]
MDAGPNTARTASSSSLIPPAFHEPQPHIGSAQLQAQATSSAVTSSVDDRPRRGTITWSDRVDRGAAGGDPEEQEARLPRSPSMRRERSSPSPIASGAGGEPAVRPVSASPAITLTGSEGFDSGGPRSDTLDEDIAAGAAAAMEAGGTDSAGEAFEDVETVKKKRIERETTIMMNAHREAKRWFERGKLRARICIAVLTFFALLVFAALVAVFAILNSKEGDASLQTVYMSHPPNAPLSNFTKTVGPSPPVPKNGSDLNAFAADICSQYDMVQMAGTVALVDPTARKISLHFTFTPCGKFAYVDPVFKRQNLNFPVNVTVSNVMFQFDNSGSPMPAMDFNAVMSSGTVNNYPLDIYTTPPLRIAGTYHDPISTNLTALPLYLTLVGALQTFSIDVPTLTDTSDAGDGTLLQLQARVQRSFTTKAFACFVMLVMWCLSILTFALSVTPWVRRYRIEAPAVAIPNTLLFALPAIRNVSPGVPAIGATADVIAFFWCEMLTSVSSLTIVANYIWFTLHPPPAPPTAREVMAAARNGTLGRMGPGGLANEGAGGVVGTLVRGLTGPPGSIGRPRMTMGRRLSDAIGVDGLLEGSTMRRRPGVGGTVAGGTVGGRQGPSSPSGVVESTPTTIMSLREAFDSFSSFGTSRNLATGQVVPNFASHMAMHQDSARFAKLCRESGLISPNCTLTDVDIVFNACKAGRKLEFAGFRRALGMLAERRGCTADHLESMVIASEPKFNGTIPDADPLLDKLTDTSLYTGTHRERFDQTTGVGKGIAGREPIAKNASLSNIVSRHNSSATLGARPPPIITPPKSPQTPRSKGTPTTSAGSTPRGSPAMARAVMSPATPKKQNSVSSPHPPSASQSGSVFDRLNSVSTFTGTHKHRFNADGTGRGKEGRTGMGAGDPIGDLSQITRK